MFDGNHIQSIILPSLQITFFYLHKYKLVKSEKQMNDFTIGTKSKNKQWKIYS